MHLIECKPKPLTVELSVTGGVRTASTSLLKSLSDQGLNQGLGARSSWRGCAVEDLLRGLSKTTQSLKGK